jgi:translocation and assembly module TamB
VAVARLEWRQGGSRLEAAGELRNFREPAITGSYRGRVSLKDIPFTPVRFGHADVEGTGHWSAADYGAEGKLSAAAVRWSSKAVDTGEGTVRARYRLAPGLLTARDVHVEALGGAWDGSFELRDWRRFSLEGAVSGLELARVVAAARREALPWNGFLSGAANLRFQLVRQQLGRVELDTGVELEAAPGEQQLGGRLVARYRQAEGTIEFDTSHLETAHSRVNFSGTLGREVRFGCLTHDLAELVAVGRTWTGAQLEVPVVLDRGQGRAEGVVRGALEAPEIAGRVRLDNAILAGRRFSSAEAEFRVSANQLKVDRARLASDGALLTGNLQLGLTEWKTQPESSLSGTTTLRNFNLADLLPRSSTVQATGLVTGTLALSGTLDVPAGEASFTIAQATLGDEKFNRVAGRVRYVGTEADGVSGNLEVDKARVEYSGSFQHARGDWNEGLLRLRLRAASVLLEEIETLQQLRMGLAGEGRLEASAALRLTPAGPRLEALDGTLSLPAIRLGGANFGSLSMQSVTKGRLLEVNTTAGLRETRIQSTAQVRLEPGYLATGTARLPPLTFRTIHDLVSDQPVEEELPVRGSLEGSATFTLPLANPREGKAQVTLTDVSLRPRVAALDSSIQPADLAVNAAGPVHAEINEKGITLSRANFTARDTSFSLRGGYYWNQKYPWDVEVVGNVELGLLTTFQPGLIASGMATLNVRLRGEAGDPQWSGRMDLKDGAFFLKDMPNGIEQASGTVTFERNRANIGKITGQTGGGTFELTGFLGLQAGEVTYRLQGTLARVRLRYPEGVSNTFDAQLSLTGSSTRSLLAGRVTVQRSSFMGESDFGSMLSDTSKPAPAPVLANEFLRGMQLDVRVRAAPEAVFQSSYASDLQSEADLSIRGSPAKPVVLGNLKVTQGEINFFGGRYTISRGEILFYNTAAIEPSIEFDLETRVRGVVVYIGISGPLKRLNVNYRSEPPLQSSEIIALLTVGRAPSSAQGAPFTSTLRTPNVMENSPNTLLAGALSAGVSSRVNKFFGASRIKIDPMLTGVDNIPQARLIFEQQVSRDITLSYVTNLNRTSQQIVRVEWDFSRQWSMVANRDENGIFSVDVLYRKRFK